MRTIDKIITKVSGKYGAPMGRHNVGAYPIKDPDMSDVDTKDTYEFNVRFVLRKKELNKGIKVFDCAVPMNGAYDKGGAYWGLPSPGEGMGQLRVSYTKDLTYINFYRK